MVITTTALISANLLIALTLSRLHISRSQYLLFTLDATCKRNILRSYGDPVQGYFKTKVAIRASRQYSSDDLSQLSPSQHDAAPLHELVSAKVQLRLE